ncbi:MAG: hypothetical protein WBB82_03610 [Limnothrix sp.]
MGFFDIFKPLETAPFLTETQVQEMERKAQQTKEQKGLISRYIKAYNQDTVGNAEIDLMWRMGKAATHKQVRTIQAETPKTIRATNEAIEAKTTKYLETYAQSLINRGGSK